jgi:hypothetical protein
MDIPDLRFGGDRRGTDTGQCCQQEAATVHSGTLGRMRTKVNQPKRQLWRRFGSTRTA